MKATFFSTPAEFRKWLEKNHNKETELWVGYYKIASGKPSMNWSQSVDEALCFGWIDGVRNSIDSESYCNRFTPRRAGSNWSDINLKKVKALIKESRMHAAGLEKYKQRKELRSGTYSFENTTKELPAAFSKQFKTNKKAWEFFNEQAPSYKKLMLHWVVSAKKEETRITRLKKLIQASAQKKRML